MKVRTEYGFTLIEMAVVLTVIGVLAAVSIPALGYMLDNYALKTTAGEIVSEMRSARQAAITENTYYELRFFPASERIYLYREDRDSGTYVLVKRLTMPVQVDLVDTNFNAGGSYKSIYKGKLYFTPAGRPYITGGTVTLKNRRGQFLYVMVVPNTGRVRASSEPPASWQ